jgi:hypothetical protein
VNFQVLRRKCATLSQAQLRHADPRVNVKAAAIAFEEELISSPKKSSEQVVNSSESDHQVEVLENCGATRRDRTGDLLITKFRLAV